MGPPVNLHANTYTHTSTSGACILPALSKLNCYLPTKLPVANARIMTPICLYSKNGPHAHKSQQTCASCVAHARVRVHVVCGPPSHSASTHTHRQKNGGGCGGPSIELRARVRVRPIGSMLNAVAPPAATATAPNGRFMVISGQLPTHARVCVCVCPADARTVDNVTITAIKLSNFTITIHFHSGAMVCVCVFLW